MASLYNDSAWSHWKRPQNLAFLFVALAVLLVAGRALQLGARVARADDLVARSERTVLQLENLRAHTEEGETARRGYSLTGEERFAQPYRAAERESATTLAALRTLVSEPEQQARIAALEQQALALFKLAREDIELQRQRDSGAEYKRNITIQADLALERCRTLIVEALTTERKAVGRGRAQAREEMLALATVLWTSMAGAILLVVLAFFALPDRQVERQAATKPARRNAAKSSAQGDSGALGEVGKLLQSSASSEDACAVVRRCAEAVFAGCSGALYLRQDADGKLVLKASWGVGPAGAATFEIAQCWALRRSEPYLVGGAGDVACEHLHQPLRTASLCVPIVAQRSVFGLLLLEEGAKPGVLEGLRAVAANFAAQVGLALANIKLQATLHDLSVHDADTGLFSRNYMEESLKREIATARRKSRSIGVAMCNLDDFMRFDDLHGRAAREFAFREIAQTIVKGIRSSDIACRYSESQVALIFPEAPLDAVVMRTNVLREAIAALELVHFEKRLGKATASIGVALLPQHGDAPAQLLQAAERAAAGAKAAGGNRVEVAAARDDGA